MVGQRLEWLNFALSVDSERFGQKNGPTVGMATEGPFFAS